MMNLYPIEYNKAQQIFITLRATYGRYTVARTGLTLTVTIVKQGGASYGSISGTVTEISNGTYRINLAAADANTLGGGSLRIAASGMDAVFVPFLCSKLLKDATLARAGCIGTTTETGGTVSVKDDDDSTELVSITYPGDAGDRTAVIA